MSRTTWPQVRLSFFWSGFLDFPPRKAEDAATPRDREQLCICRLNARTYLAAAPPAFTVWITIAHLFVAITTAVCVSLIGSSPFSPLWLTNNTLEIHPSPSIQSQLIYNAALLRAFGPSLACPFSHNAQHPPDDSNPHLPPPALTWEIFLRCCSV